MRSVPAIDVPPNFITMRAMKTFNIRYITIARPDRDRI
jgi:hypothetical protein